MRQVRELQEQLESERLPGQVWKGLYSMMRQQFWAEVQCEHHDGGTEKESHTLDTMQTMKPFSSML